MTRQRPEKLWSHRLAGMQPQLYVAGARIFVQLSDWNSNRQGDAHPQTLCCLNAEGRLLWSLRGAELREILDDGCLIDSLRNDPGRRFDGSGNAVDQPRGDLRRIDDSGSVSHRVRGEFIVVKRVGDRLLLIKDDGKVRLTDLAFKRVRRVRGNHRFIPQQCCRRGEELYSISNDGTISQFNRRAKRRTFATVSAQTIEQTFTDFESATGFSVCEGWLGEYPKPKNRAERDLLLRTSTGYSLTMARPMCFSPQAVSCPT